MAWARAIRNQREIQIISLCPSSLSLLLPKASISPLYLSEITGRFVTQSVVYSSKGSSYQFIFDKRLTTSPCFDNVNGQNAQNVSFSGFKCHTSYLWDSLLISVRGIRPNTKFQPFQTSNDRHDSNGGGEREKRGRIKYVREISTPIACVLIHCDNAHITRLFSL